MFLVGTFRTRQSIFPESDIKGKADLSVFVGLGQFMTPTRTMRPRGLAGYAIANPRDYFSPERLQPRLDLRSPRFQKRRQRQFFAERFHRLVGGEARTVGGDL